jgi:hypothetical protein
MNSAQHITHVSGHCKRLYSSFKNTSKLNNKVIDIFSNITPAERQNKEYITLTTCSGFSPAKNLIEEISQEFTDKDGNFVEQFQSTGFYQRLWELFLSQLIKELDLTDISVKHAPDFHLQKNGVDFFLEATSSNPADKDEFTVDYIEKAFKEKDLKIQNDLIDYYTIKIGSALKSKLDNKYWELSWVAGKPLVIAIKPSHNKFANWLPDYKIIEYLYGIGTKTSKNEDGIKAIENTVVEEQTKCKCHKGFRGMRRSEVRFNFSCNLIGNHPQSLTALTLDRSFPIYSLELDL